jgi:hypothetical protein
VLIASWRWQIVTSHHAEAVIMDERKVPEGRNVPLGLLVTGNTHQNEDGTDHHKHDCDSNA